MRKRNSILVGVYGSLKAGFHNHGVLGNSKLVGKTWTEPKFKMFDIGSFPGVVEGSNKISLEVYEVDSEQIKIDLDRLEGYPDFYGKKSIDTEFGSTIIYTFNPSTDGLEEVKSGNWTKK